MDKETKKIDGLPVYKLTVNECSEGYCDTTETNFISLVSQPAIEVDFISFSKETIKPQTFKIQDSSKHMLVGPLMIADLPIYRKDPETGDEYYVVFDADAIENCAKNFAKKNYNSNINMEHDSLVDNAYLLESWIVADPKKDKSAAYGFKNVTKGSWMGVVYCPNETIWNQYIKNGTLKGFSVEGLYQFSPVQADGFSKQEKLTPEEEKTIDNLTQIILKNKNFM